MRTLQAGDVLAAVNGKKTWEEPRSGVDHACHGSRRHRFFLRAYPQVDPIPHRVTEAIKRVMIGSLA